MSDDTYGACVVLLPGANDLPEEIEGGHHITLAYLGDKDLPGDLFQDLLEIVEKVSLESGDLSTDISVKSDEFFGEQEEAHVLTLDSTPTSPAVVLRKRILDSLTPELQNIFEEAETWPEYKPHMTLGYTNEGYVPQSVDIPDDLPLVGVAVWNGDNRVAFPLDLRHYGTPRKSGRYPWGSGENPNQRHKPFLAIVDDLKKKGLTETQIAEGMGMSTTELRARKAIEKNNLRKNNAAEAFKMKERGMSNVAIGERLGIPESSVRALLNPAMQAKNDELVMVANELKRHMTEKDGYLDIGAGVEQHLGISDTKLRTAVAMLEQEGYVVHNVQVDQAGTGSGKKTTIKVLAPEGTTYRDIVSDTDRIKSVSSIDRPDGSRLGLEPPRSVSSKRVGVRYAEDGGADMDGVIQIRRGVDDVSLGNSRYAQVRIAVDDSHYLKGMAMYSDDLPPGVDIMFNTNKSNTGNKLDAMKKLKDDPDNPFGSVIKQKYYVDKNGKEQLSALNIVNEEGAWHRWSKNLSSQMLSKQSPALAKDQLDLAYDIKKAEYDSIVALTNPVVKQKLLQSFSDGADASAVHLKAAGLPRTRNHVILPVTDMKDTEIYAPNYRDGEKVVLIRHPHGGKFEIPELTVNNRHPGAKKALGNAIDAVGIHPKVAERLSGADFDGDTVLVIPNNSRKVKSEPALAGLKDFDPKIQYKAYEGMKPMSARTKQREMGDVSNLITDMTIKGANNAELARAVRHSMVVIDAEKHNLDYKRSAAENGIRELKVKYQGKDGQPGKPNSGASTLISLAGSEARIPVRKERKASQGGPIDPRTGKKVYVETGESYTDAKGNTILRTEKAKKLAITDDARTLSSGTPMEEVYATHSNKLKALANEARKEMLATKPRPISPSAKKVYAAEVDSLNAKLNLALKNKPLERRAQLVANSTISAKRQANPDMAPEDLKKIKGQALEAARHRVGAEKTRIDITPSEWDAIQAGAISTNKLSQILDNADLDQVKAMATPRTARVMTAPVMAKAKNLLARGYTQAEVADALGIPASTLNGALLSEGS